MLETVELATGTKLELVWIPAGSFNMGSPEHEDHRQSGESPQHVVTISQGFWMGKYQVTQEQWTAVMGNNPSHYQGLKNPVEMVRWYDCQEFLKRLNKKVLGKRFRLPTEAEWEYSCRAGSSSSYYFGDDSKQLGDYAWYSRNSKRSTHPVGRKKPNAWSFHDMHGNVWEWCQDWYADYSSSDQFDPKGPKTGTFRVLRGGARGSYDSNCRSAMRYYQFPGNAENYIGFRLVSKSQLKPD